MWCERRRRAHRPHRLRELLDRQFNPVDALSHVTNGNGTGTGTGTMVVALRERRRNLFRELLADAGRPPLPT